MCILHLLAFECELNEIVALLWALEFKSSQATFKKFILSEIDIIDKNILLLFMVFFETLFFSYG